jgi:hypothetical protein
MPSLFRIIAGGGNNNNGAQRSTNSAAGMPPSASMPASSTAASNSNTTTTRYSYPGMRAAASPPSSSGSLTSPAPLLPTPLPRTGGLPPPMNPAAAASTTSTPVVIRGSQVDGTAATTSATSAAASAPVLSSAASSLLASSATSSTSSSTAAASSSSTAAAAAPGTKLVAQPHRPGAYLVTRTSTGPAQVYRVTVPVGVRPGAEFTVHAGPRRVRVRCPTSSLPGQSLQITLPPEPVTHHVALQAAPLTAATAAGGGAHSMTPEVARVNEQAAQVGGTALTYLVTIPPGIYPGMQFCVNVGANQSATPPPQQRFMVTCPANAYPGQKVRIVPPPTEEEQLPARDQTQEFEVAVPPGVSPGKPFALIANGQRVLVTCPPNVTTNQRIRFRLPVSQVVSHIHLKYESQGGGWNRNIRATDLKFVWVRLEKTEKVENLEELNPATKTRNDEDDDDDHEQQQQQIDSPPQSTSALVLDEETKFDFGKAAYVRKLQFLEGNDARMRTGTLSLIPADQAVVDSRLVVPPNRVLLSYADIAAVQGKTLDEKTAWFQNICHSLTAAWEDGHVKLLVRRKYLLLDAVDAVMSLSREDLRKRWRLEFLGEPAIDAGGVTREWFELVTQQLYDPDFGLWLPSVNNQMCCNINPASGTYYDAGFYA